MEIINMIGMVLEEGSQVVIYDERQRRTACVFLSGGKLLGYTSTTFSIKRGCEVVTYNERGRRISSKIG